MNRNGIKLRSIGKGKFPVKRGEQIALSVATGSSGGPHLHFGLGILKPKNHWMLWYFFLL